MSYKETIDSCPIAAPTNGDAEIPTPAMDPYERYRLEWMIAHGYSLRDLMKALAEYQREAYEDSEHTSTPASELFDEWEHDIGFDSEIWACRPEWEDSDAK